MSLLYKHSNWLWKFVIRHRITQAVWKPLVQLTRLRHLRYRARLAREEAVQFLDICSPDPAECLVDAASCRPLFSWQSGVYGQGKRRFDLTTRRLGHSGLTALLMLLAVGGVAAPVAPIADPDPDAVVGFRAMMNDAVARMHAGMQVPFTGDADRDFARMMIPHHQGAIDMALVELRYGKDQRLKRLAQEIIVAQQQEIAVMHLALGDALPPGSPAPTQLSPDPKVHHER
jgi:hypothetical protein